MTPRKDYGSRSPTLRRQRHSHPRQYGQPHDNQRLRCFGRLDLCGQLADVNTALDGLVYTPSADFFGSDTLTVITSDNGGTGSGGPLTKTDTLSIIVQPVNDAPVNTLPSTQNTNEDTSLTFSAANQNAISVYDDASMVASPSTSL